MTRQGHYSTERAHSLSHIILGLDNCMPPHTLSNRQTHRSELEKIELMGDWISKSSLLRRKETFVSLQINNQRWSLRWEFSLETGCIILPGNAKNIFIYHLISEHTSGSIDIMIIISTLFLQFAPCASGCGWCIVDDGCVSCRPSEVLMMSLLSQPGYGTGAVSRPG